LRKNLQHITLKTNTENSNFGIPKTIISSEEFSFKTKYSKDDVEGLKPLNFAAGIPPFLRGIHSYVHTEKPWKTVEYKNLSTAEINYTSYKENLKSNQKKGSLVFKIEQHKTSSSPNLNTLKIDTVEDIKRYFDKIPLNEISVSIPLNNSALPILAFYIVAAEERGVDLKQLKGNLQSHISQVCLLEYSKAPLPKLSKKIISDIFEFTNKNMPEFNHTGISSFNMQKPCLSIEIDLAYTLAHGLEYIKKGVDAGLDIDKLAQSLTFFWGIGMHHFMEIAKVRAARMLWAKLIKPFNPKDSKSLALNSYSQTLDSALTEQDSFNNVARTTIEAAAAVFAGTQSLNTNTLENTTALPTNFSSKIATNTHLYLQNETQITKTVDPWAGSFLVENSTAAIANKAWTLIEEVEALGGITKAIQAGIPKLRIKEAVARSETKLDASIDLVPNINKHILKKEAPISKIEIKTTQVEHINKIKLNRHTEKVNTALLNLSEAALTKQNNLLALAIEAARERATFIEITDALKNN
jgi:methylmalonyl-CoA mutase